MAVGAARASLTQFRTSDLVEWRLMCLPSGPTRKGSSQWRSPLRFNQARACFSATLGSPPHAPSFVGPLSDALEILPPEKRSDPPPKTSHKIPTTPRRWTEPWHPTRFSPPSIHLVHKLLSPFLQRLDNVGPTILSRPAARLSTTSSAGKRAHLGISRPLTHADDGFTLPGVWAAAPPRLRTAPRLRATDAVPAAAPSSPEGRRWRRLLQGLHRGAVLLLRLRGGLRVLR